MTSTLNGVAWNAELGIFVVSDYEAASAILRGTGWSSDPRNSPLAPPEIAQLPNNVMLFMDPPDHTRLRRLVAPAFAPRAIEKLRPRVVNIVEAALDGLDPDDMELMADYSYLVPLAVIAELLDVGAEGAELFQTHTPRLVKMLEVDATPDDMADAVDASLEIMMWLTPELVDRRRHPGDDFISAMLSQEDMSVDEVLGMCVLLLAAGHETTANLIGNGTLAVLRHPEQRALLLGDPDRAIEELLRVENPVNVVGRTALVDSVVGGVEIPAGSAVMINIRDANIDSGRFPGADQLDLSRAPVGHLAFGAGPHFCLGSALSRLESVEALSRLFARFPDLRLADAEPQWRQSATFHALEELWLVGG